MLCRASWEGWPARTPSPATAAPLVWKSRKATFDSNCYAFQRVPDTAGCQEGNQKGNFSNSQNLLVLLDRPVHLHVGVKKGLG